MPAVTIDGTEYDVEQLSDSAKGQLASLQACENKLRQLQTEIAIVQTARTAYAMALKGELPENGTVTAADSDLSDTDSTH